MTTPWGAMLSDALRMGIGPEAFWRLSVREWRMLTEPQRAASMDRTVFERLASEWPDDGAAT
ncbi:phage tail assembly chaperone [soil metagenome]